MAGFARLQRDGKIRHHGVSNFNTSDMQEWVGLGGGESVASNQILYNLGRRGPEWELIPWCRERRVPLHVFPWAAAHGSVGLAQDAAYLIRPDTYVAVADPSGSASALASYGAERDLRFGAEPPVTGA